MYSTNSQLSQLGNSGVKELKDDARLFYCASNEDGEIGPMTNKGVRLDANKTQKTVLRLTLAQSAHRCTIPHLQAQEWEPGFSGTRLFGRTPDYQYIGNFLRDRVETLQKLSQAKPFALVPRSRLNFVKLRTAGFSSMCYVKEITIETPSTSASHDDSYYILTLTDDGKVSPLPIDHRNSISLADVADWMLSVPAPVVSSNRLTAPTSRVTTPRNARTKLPNGPVPLPLLQVLPAMHRKMETVYNAWVGKETTQVEAEAFSQHKPMSIGLVNTYMRLLRIDEHRDRRSFHLDAVDVGQPLKAEFLQELSKSSDKRPDRIFLPCWTKQHVSLVVIKPKAEPKPMIEVWDPLPKDERFNWLESHGVIQVIKQHIGATVEIELTHATKLPFVVEKQESGVIALMVARRLSRHTSESEKAAMKGLLSLEASQSWKWEAEHIAQMRKMMFNEMFISRHLVDPPHNLVESAPYGPFH